MGEVTLRLIPLAVVVQHNHLMAGHHFLFAIVTNPHSVTGKHHQVA